MIRTHKEIEHLPFRERPYRVAVDGTGLYIYVNGAGKNKPEQKNWLARFNVDGRDLTRRLGSFPQMSLKDAKDACGRFLYGELPRLIESGGISKPLNPNAVVESKGVQGFADQSLAEIAQRWLEKAAKDKKWTDKYRTKITNALHTHILSAIGSSPAISISGPDLKRLLDKMTADGKYSLAIDLQQVLVRIWTLIAFEDPRVPNVAMPLKQFLVRPEESSQARVHFKYVGWVFDQLDQALTCIVQKAFAKLLILTALRHHELAEARWEWVDFEKKTMTVPKSVMGPGYEDHVVPLAPVSLLLLKELLSMRLHDKWVFPRLAPGGKKLHVHENTVLLGLEKIGLKGHQTGHGFRGMFSTWVGETIETDRARDAAEMQLSHAVGNKVRRAYDKSVMMLVRVELMDGWAQYVEQQVAWARARATISTHEVIRTSNRYSEESGRVK